MDESGRRLGKRGEEEGDEECIQQSDRRRGFDM